MVWKEWSLETGASDSVGTGGDDMSRMRHHLAAGVAYWVTAVTAGRETLFAHPPACTRVWTIRSRFWASNSMGSC